jgi:hypothetical protein
MLDETRRPKKLWERNPEEYRIFLAYDLTQESSKEKISFYERIGELCDRMGYPAFLPHRTLGIGYKEGITDRDVYVTCNEIIMPHVDLVIAYLGIPSADVGSMIGRAKLLGKDIIYLFERKLAREVVDGFKRNVAYIFHSTEGLKSIKILSKEEDSLDAVYSFSSPESMLKHIENLRKAEIHFPFAVIKFDREEEALEFLEKEIDDFFKRYRK